MTVNSCLVVLATALAPAVAQTLAVFPETLDGGKSTLTVMMDASGRNDTVAMQFEIRLPAQKVSTESVSITAGAAASSAGKTINCSGHWIKAPQTYTYVCIVAGGQGAIGSGAIAKMQVEPAPGSKRGSYKVGVERAITVDAAGNKRSLKSAEASVSVLR